ncbi:MAG: hypothetical protein PHU81_04450 [Acidobacteriota bacterium]|nr:hypothetical protein [Acidobacteriota bacterium]
MCSRRGAWHISSWLTPIIGQAHDEPDEKRGLRPPDKPFHRIGGGKRPPPGELHVVGGAMIENSVLAALD